VTLFFVLFVILADLFVWHTTARWKTPVEKMVKFDTKQPSNQVFHHCLILAFHSDCAQRKEENSQKSGENCVKSEENPQVFHRC
jgi:hypothetical protein